MKILKTLKQENMGSGYLYFYIHMITEIACFYTLSNLIGDSIYLWLIPFIYDALAFVPQSLIGYLNDKYPKINFCLIGILLLLIGFITFNLKLLPGEFMALIILCFGNCFIHVSGAEVTLRCSNGKLSHSAIFVSGGSFGVITGKLCAKYGVSLWFIAFLILTIIPISIVAEYYKKDTLSLKNPCKNFVYHNKNINSGLIILLAVFVVIARGYCGYGIPTSWNKSVFETIMLYVTMGLGKAMGGILSDTYGIRKISIISIIGSLPFLLLGDNLMIVSLIGVMLFSMTMSITLAILVSVLKNKPGLAFGLTTIGLFLGTAPIFFIKITNSLINSIVISILTIICLLIVLLIIRKDNKV